MSKHPLHRMIGDYLAEVNFPSCRVVLDEACCESKEHVQLFCSEFASEETRMCGVDALILKDETIRVIIEIEESGVKPRDILGKVFASSLAQYFVDDPGNPIGMHDSVLFIQIVCPQKLNVRKTSKFRQWGFLAKAIRALVPIGGSKIDHYSLAYVNSRDFEKSRCVEMVIDRNELKRVKLMDCIREALI